MELSYYKINPTGNITLIVETPVPRESQSRVAAELMARDASAEQVGFLEKTAFCGSDIRLQMMGGEFCGNASISAAALAAREKGMDEGVICLEISGMDKSLFVQIQKEREDVYSGTVSMPLPESVGSIRIGATDLPLVHFPGISHIIADESLDRRYAEEIIGSVCRELGADALGIMFRGGDRLEPLVYVPSTDTAVWESSCASGSTAVAAYLACKDGQSHSVSLRQQGGVLCVEARCEDGLLSSLSLTGTAEILGRHLICT